MKRKMMKKKAVVKMNESIEKLVQYVVSDIERIREYISESERIGIEIMALNALCNAKKTLKNKCQQSTSTCKGKCQQQHYRK